MFKLKTYQDETLNILRQFLQTARLDGAPAAFAAHAQNSFPNPQDYLPIEGLPDAPYICLRLPTGGGKTLMAAHSIGIAAQAFLEQDYPLVLWLMPTNTIREQTLGTLTKPGHPNREALENAFSGRVLVLDIADFAQIRPQDLRDRTCVVVGTLATLRVNSTEGRKVYAHNENLEPHFSTVPDSTPGLERIEEGADAGKIKFSFRNLLALHRPLVLVDEAHNASSDLSFEIMRRINPACVIEFTATPAANSNILYHVAAARLKAEEMIKLPIVLTEHQTWQEALRDSILTRQKLQELAAREKDFVRPIVLIQAESKDREVTVEVVKNHLVEQEKIPRERIAIATGAQRELDGINLLDPENKTEFVITVEALKEGWDCPFAYVFCSVANVHSKKDVEQLLGRVLRMPYARRRKQEDLNRAYAHVSSASWPQAVNQLCDRLVDMGFEEQEAEQFVQPQLTLPPLDGSGALRTDEPLQLTLREKPDLSYLTIEEQASISVVPTQGGQVVLQVRGKISDEFESRLLDALPEHDRAAAQRTIAVHRRHHRLSPSERGETFVVPQLCLWIDGELELADEESFIGPTGWNLLDYPAQLSEFEFSIREESESFEIDIQGKRLVTRYLGAQAALDLNDAQTTWTNLQLSRKLDPRLRDKNIKQEVLLEFIRQTIDYLTERRKIPLAALWRAQYPLQKALAAKIQDYKEQAYQNGYQRNLLDPGAPVETSYEYSYTFPKDYAPNSIYRGRFQFEHHFYPLVGAFDSDEEFDCAEVIDRSKRINTWIRNLSQSDAAFRLPLASGNFYPDFVVNLAHERILIVEYKGAHLVNDPKEKQKRNIGEKWEEASHGKAMFLWAVKRDEQGRDLYHQFEDKIAQTA